MDDRDDLTRGDPLGGAEPARPPAPERPAPSYGGGPVPPGAFAPRETPQRISPDADFADWWRRAVAAILDAIIVGGATLLLLALLGVGVFADGDVGTGELIVGALLGTIIFAVLALLYAPILMARTNGQTLGKMATDCRVVRANGKPVDFGWSVIREVAVKGIVFGVAGSVTGGLANIADWLWPLFDKEDRALHDFLVDSRVIRA
jgi:uncharacterized RDD family membrane protein YckC